MTPRIRTAGLLAFLLGSTLTFTGCTTSDLPASASFASVVITGVSAEKINQATIAVLTENGYDEPLIGPKEMVFEKEGTRSDVLAHDGLRAMQKGEVALKRVTTELVELPHGSYRLQCQAYIISNLNGNREKENRVFNRKSEPYQNMLDEVASRL
jgi:hypothetical protein